MRVGIDISPLKSAHKFRGIGSYAKQLIRALEQEVKRKKEIEIIPVDFRHKPYAIRHSPFDLVHYPYFDLFFLTLPLRKSTKTIVTIHDVIPLVFPQHYPPGIRGKIKFLIQRFSLQGTSAVITDSENSKKDIFKYLNYPVEKTFVVSLAPGEKFRLITNHRSLITVKREYSLPDRFILYVGDVNWNKNVLSLAKACKKIKLPLVIVGKQATQKDFDKTHIENQPLVQLIELFDKDSDIKGLGFVPEKDLVKIYNLATVYCQPSFYEGFGLPVLEAMACGCPVVAARVASLPEICGQAALMVDPRDYNGIARGLEKVTGDRKTRDRLVTEGFKQVRKFSWEKTAEETLKIYEKVAKKS